MAADSNTGFHQRTAPSSLYNRHMVSFQSGEAASSTRMIPTGMDGFVGVSSSTGMVFTGNPGVINETAVLIPGRNTASCLHLDRGLALQDSAGLAVDWSFDEQTLLEEGLVKYANEPNIMRYIKIAAMLKNKTVRDVALRCRWMTKKEAGKRRKQEEYYTGKKMKDKKLQENINLFFHMKNNVTTILNRMSEMPGIMRRMPPLPVSVDEELFSSLLPSASEAFLFGTSSSICLKQEPRC
ncbi:hypothetical protein Taro_010909 [Colocasia esculenta]|uniref:Uncharacterized protein n=1 Tax=Colocasia esculenta TaxID=4460 RepID=A0A843U8D6_COLES|nr:hypothetical protein [Colocasia esculenta]